MPPPPPLVTTYHAATFAERGLFVPFTSPALAGTRLRRAVQLSSGPQPRSVLDAIVPNPGGGRGLYIVPWSNVGTVARPTVHDLRLGDSLAFSMLLGDELRPSMVRQIAREIAKSGVAGRQAAAAAVIAADLKQAREATCRSEILQGLASTLDLAHAAYASQTEILALVSARLNRPHQALAVALKHLSELALAFGVLPDVAQAEVPRVMSAIAQMVGEIRAFAHEQPTAAGTAVVAAASACLKLTRHAVDATRTQTAQLPNVLCALVDSPEPTLGKLERAEWLLDGWQQLCLVWSTVHQTSARLAALAEMASLVPVLPDEVERWFNLPAGSAQEVNAARRLGLSRPSKQGAEFDAVARNESFRALAA